MDAQELIERIKANEKARGDAWQEASQAGAGAVKPLAAVMADPDIEVSRAAKRGLWQIVRHAGRPGADSERKTVVTELVALLGGEQPVVVRREALWMVSELGGDEVVSTVAVLLAHPELRGDACMVLERLPGEAPLDALRAGLAAAPEEFKPNIIHSLRARGVPTAGPPCQKLVPSKPTTVRPAGR